jgi:glycosyltransferase involved in cell wall biosynthesis
MKRSGQIAFVSTMEGVQWGGSEELWARAASGLLRQGIAVSANVLAWPTDHPRIAKLEREGVRVHRRSARASLLSRAASKLRLRARSPRMGDFREWLKEQRPALVVLSNGGALPPIELAELCLELNLPFVNIAQANHEDWWPDDAMATRYRVALRKALRCYFVSRANLILAERQIGCALPNAEVVHNPFNVDHRIAPPWPAEDGAMHLASVGRLHTPSKGQDILFGVLASPRWADRNWRLTLFGEGPHREGLERLAERFDLGGRVRFAGHTADVAAIWAEHHMLVLPSRYEGLPLVLVEAMLCGRPAVVTDVAGNGEVMIDGKTGFVAESPTVPALARAMELAWENRHDLRALGHAAARHIRQIVPDDPAAEFAAKLTALLLCPKAKDLPDQATGERIS